MNQEETHRKMLPPETHEPCKKGKVLNRVRDRERSGEKKTETLPLYLVMRRSVITFSRPV